MDNRLIVEEKKMMDCCNKIECIYARPECLPKNTFCSYWKILTELSRKETERE